MYGSAFNRPYRCVVKYIKSYVIEELANLIFIGSYIAKCGPPGFKTLWMRLQPAVHHYLYGKDDTLAQRAAAETSLRQYAQKLENFVLEGKVGFSKPAHRHVHAASSNVWHARSTDRCFCRCHLACCLLTCTVQCAGCPGRNGCGAMQPWRTSCSWSGS